MVGFCHGGNMPASQDDDNDDGDDDDDHKRMHVFNINLLKVEKLQRPSAYPLEHSQNLGVAVSGKL